MAACFVLRQSFAVYPRLALNSCYSCLSLSTGIRGEHYNLFRICLQMESYSIYSFPLRILILRFTPALCVSSCLTVFVYLFTFWTFGLFLVWGH